MIELRNILLDSFQEGLKSLDPEKLIQNAIKLKETTESQKSIITVTGYSGSFSKIMNLDVSHYKKCLIIGGGKATAPMVNSLIRIIGKKIECYGTINVPYGQNWGDEINFLSGKKKSSIKINYSGHPIPDMNGLLGTKKIVELVCEANNDTLIFILISGGGSALMPLPREGISLEDLQAINSLLLKGGVSINEINAVRKHLSDFKGGNLAKYIYPKSSISLIISDVIGDPLDVIASGPTVPDESTFNNVFDILNNNKILDTVPNVKKMIMNGINKEIDETPKKKDKIFSKINNLIIGSAKNAEIVMRKIFEENKFSDLSKIDETLKLPKMFGEAKEFGSMLSKLIIKIDSKEKLLKKNRSLYLISSGEFTVTIKGNGKGGRNQEMLLSLLDSIKKYNLNNINYSIVSMAFDGIEGNSPAAGAILDSESIEKMENLDIKPKDFLDSNNSYGFFKKMKDSIEMGQTQTNTNDICAILLRSINF